jgi:hypothetical protein
LNEVTHRLLHSQHEIEELRSELENLHDDVVQRDDALVLRSQEIYNLQRVASHAEDKIAQLKDLHRHELEASKDIMTDLQIQLADLQTDLAARDEALQSALTDSETHKTIAADQKSRLETYLAELDRVKVSEAELRGKVSDLVRESSGHAIKTMELEKKIQALEEDKELLNVAVDSKQTELVLLQRTGASANASTKKPVTPMGHGHGQKRFMTVGHSGGASPVASRAGTGIRTRNTDSPRSTATIRGNRPLPPPWGFDTGSPAMDKSTSTAADCSMSRPALVSSTAHNTASTVKLVESSTVTRTIKPAGESKVRASKPAAEDGLGNESRETTLAGLKRQSSLPVLVKRNSGRLSPAVYVVRGEESMLAVS